MCAIGHPQIGHIDCSPTRGDYESAVLSRLVRPPTPSSPLSQPSTSRAFPPSLQLATETSPHFPPSTTVPLLQTSAISLVVRSRSQPLGLATPLSSRGESGRTESEWNTSPRQRRQCHSARGPPSDSPPWTLAGGSADVEARARGAQYRKTQLRSVSQPLHEHNAHADEAHVCQPAPWEGAASFPPLTSLQVLSPATGLPGSPLARLACNYRPLASRISRSILLLFFHVVACMLCNGPRSASFVVGQQSAERWRFEGTSFSGGTSQVEPEYEGKCAIFWKPWYTIPQRAEASGGEVKGTRVHKGEGFQLRQGLS